MIKNLSSLCTEKVQSTSHTFPIGFVQFAIILSHSVTVQTFLFWRDSNASLRGLFWDFTGIFLCFINTCSLEAMFGVSCGLPSIDAKEYITTIDEDLKYVDYLTQVVISWHHTFMSEINAIIDSRVIFIPGISVTLFNLKNGVNWPLVVILIQQHHDLFCKKSFSKILEQSFYPKKEQRFVLTFHS